MRKTLTIAVALVATAAVFAFAAVAARGTHSAAQRVGIEVKGTDPFTFELKPVSHGRVQADRGEATFCCWRNWSVTRAGAKFDASNPRLILTGAQGRRGTLRIRERIEWVALPDGWSVCTGTWKVVPGAGTGPYAGLSGHGRVACAWAPETDPDRALRLRLYGFLAPK